MLRLVWVSFVLFLLFISSLLSLPSFFPHFPPPSQTTVDGTVPVEVTTGGAMEVTESMIVAALKILVGEQHSIMTGEAPTMEGWSNVVYLLHNV